MWRLQKHVAMFSNTPRASSPALLIIYLFVATSLSLEQLSFHIFRRGYKSRFLVSPPVSSILRAHPQNKGEFPSLNACLSC